MNVIKLSKKASKRGGDHTNCRKKHSYKASILVLVCGGLCVCVRVWDSLARKSHFKQLCGGYQAKNSGGQFISLASC